MATLSMHETQRRIELIAESAAVRRPNAQSDKHGSKNRPRNTRSLAQKTRFYQWIITNIDHPFPTDRDRQALCIDAFDKKDFYWWFSNHRHRNLTCTVDDEGKKHYRPKLTFYRTCQRLGLDIPWAIPDEIKRHLKRIH
ncbi:hypothetical protein H4218_002846 [Coemansia sp. IMI 209128]|nr:hypothetical protein H4218_002846 [Coemansia sp. IMI 209128]